MISGLIVLAIGLVLVVASIGGMSQHPHEPNSPFLWLFLFVGLVAAGFGAILLLLH